MRHEVLYPVHRLDDAALRRLATSIRSVREASRDVSVLVQDTSPGSSLQAPIEALASIDGYEHTPGPPALPYNNARAINLAFRHFVKGPHFFVFHIDIVVPADFFESILADYRRHRLFVTPTVYYMPESVTDYANFAELERATPLGHWWGSASLYDSALFERVNGYDEDYFGWGAEDDDLHGRLALLTGHSGRTEAIRCYHQYHPRCCEAQEWFSRERLERNQARYRSRFFRYRRGELRPDEVQGLRAASRAEAAPA